MKPPPLDYTRPATVGEAVALLAEHGDEAKVLAGGQSLVPLLSMRFARPALLVDVNRIGALAELERDGDTLRVGACVRQADFGASQTVRREVPLAAAAVPWIGHHVTRNRGTVGGSLAHADARAELPLALVALGGSVVVASVRGSREIRASELFATHFTTTLEPDELLVESRWPLAGPGWGYAFEEFAQRHGDYALAMVAVAVERSAGSVRQARIAIGAAADRPERVPAAEAALVQGAGAEEAAAIAAGALEPPDDFHASAAYRRQLVRVLTARAIERAFPEAAQ